MQHSYTIPSMSEKELLKWYQTIKPIVCHNGDFKYLRELSPYELTKINYIGLREFSDTVDFSTLGILADIKVLHPYRYQSLFNPSVAEVIRQIPKELRNDTIAFEIIYSPYGVPDFEIFKDEFNQLFHVSIVRLYKKFDGKCPKAKKLLEYPTKFSCLPINMEEEKFKKLLSK